MLSAAFNNRQLITTGADGAIKFWNCDQPSPPPAHGSPVSAVDISGDEAWAASGDREGKVFLWQLAPATSALSLFAKVDAHQVKIGLSGRKRLNRKGAKRQREHGEEKVTISNSPPYLSQSILGGSVWHMLPFRAVEVCYRRDGYACLAL